MNQYFIKIKQDSQFVSFGELINRKNRRVLLDYQKENENLILSKPQAALQWIADEIDNPVVKIIFFIHGLVCSRPMVLSRNSKVFRNDYSSNNQIRFIHIIWNNGKIRYKKNLLSLMDSTKTLNSIFNMVDTVFNYSSLMCQSMGNRFFLNLSYKIKLL